VQIIHEPGRALPDRWRSASSLNRWSVRRVGRSHVSVTTLVVVVAVFFGGLMPTEAAQAAPEMGVAYHVKFRHSSKCLDVPDGTTHYFVQLQQYACVDTNNQRFLLEPTGTDISGRQYYRVRNVQSNLCLYTDWRVSDWAPIMQHPCWPSRTSTSEWFTLIRSSGMPDDYYKLMSYHSEKCVNVAGASWDNHARIIQYACDGYWPQGTDNMQVRFFRFR
jgi:hypothetical protein